MSFLFLFISEAKGSEWLGEYVGSEIPGYEILKSIIIYERNIGGPIGDLDELKIGSSLAKSCRTAHGGRAIVNLKFIISVGEVSWREGGGIRKISPGGYIGIYGDCVTGVRKK